jgi:hypothetical protein
VTPTVICRAGPATPVSAGRDSTKPAIRSSPRIGSSGNPKVIARWNITGRGAARQLSFGHPQVRVHVSAPGRSRLF